MNLYGPWAGPLRPPSRFGWNLDRPRNGDPSLSWAFSEAASFARRFQPLARRFYDRKCARKGPAIAFRALAHKLARASYFMLRDQSAYEPTRLFH